MLVTKRAWPEIDAYISLLFNRSLKPMKYDNKKLKSLLQLLMLTIADYRINSADNIQNLEVWVDASYAVHDDMWGYNCGCMYIGWGVVHFCASKQNINTKISTDTEVVVVIKYPPFPVCHITYMGAQGWTIKYYRLNQYNTSSILIDNNGGTLASKINGTSTLGTSLWSARSIKEI